jgi:hypothetical protein
MERFNLKKPNDVEIKCFRLKRNWFRKTRNIMLIEREKMLEISRLQPKNIQLTASQRNMNYGSTKDV